MALAAEALQALNLAFPPSKYNPCFHVGRKNKATGAVYPLGFQVGSSKLSDFAGKMYVLENNDYYIAANGFIGDKRTKDNLLSLNNIVVDIDIHNDLEPFERNELLNKFVWLMQRDGLEIPACNIVHFTGRGVQLWWCIEQASSKLLFLYDAAVSRVLECLETFKSGYDELAQISIDAAASRNAAGYFRLFGTYNTKTQQKTEVFITSNERNKLDDFLDGGELPKKPAGGLTVLPNTSSGAALNYRRLEFLQRLCRLRNGVLRFRHNAVFYFYNAAVQIHDRATAMHKTLEYNRGFAAPLPEKHIKDIARCVDKRGCYKLTNAYIIAGLQLDQGEQDKLNFKPFTGTVDFETRTQNYTRDRVRAEKKNDRDEIIISLAKEGQTVAAIAAAAACSARTVRTVAAAQGVVLKRGRPWPP